MCSIFSRLLDDPVYNMTCIVVHLPIIVATVTMKFQYVRFPQHTCSVYIIISIIG